MPAPPPRPPSRPAVPTAEALLLVAEHVAARYGRHTALHDVSLEIRRGQVTTLVGPNGSGKTTMLRVLLGLLRPHAGSVRAPGGRPRIGYVPQADRSETVFPVSALEVVLMGLTPSLGWLRRAGRAQHLAARDALARLRVADLAGRMFRDLSGGQRQRVLLARALVAGPQLLVLDEPVRGLDFASTNQLVRLLHDLAHVQHLGVLVATHSLELVANHADVVALFRAGRCEVGPVAAMLDDEHLSRYHGMPVRVRTVEGQTVVLPGPDPEPEPDPAPEPAP